MAVSRNSDRPYKKQVRAATEAATRQRIVEAAVALHLERGPVQTSINAVAERAGVNRVTVYRHFPDERSLFEACSAHARSLFPPPDLAGWRSITDPRERIEVGLAQLYDYFRRTEEGWANVLRDAELSPIVKQMVETRLAYLREARDVLLAGWPSKMAGQPPLRGALGLAVSFRTWQTLARREELDDRTIVDLMLRLATAVGEHD
jgi:AcrR family transcriptional regulator